MGLGCCKEQMGGVVSVSEIKNQAPRVLQKVRGSLGSTLVSFTNKTNNCLQMNILAWLKKLVKFKARGEGILGGFVEGREENKRVEEWVLEQIFQLLNESFVTFLGVLL
ncbi:unnamed protein product [Prunus armeniaca]